MKSIPREGVSKQAIDRFLLRRYATGGGIDYSAHLQMPNDLTTLRNYFSQMTMVDDGVGRVLDALNAQGLDDNTLVIYTCDHGFFIGSQWVLGARAGNLACECTPGELSHPAADAAQRPNRCGAKQRTNDQPGRSI